MSNSPLTGEQLPSFETLAEDLYCGRCSYNLRGLAPDARCPECGTAVALSLQGNWLHLADPIWLRRLRLGAALKLWGLLVGVFVGVAAGAMTALAAPARVFIAAGALGGLFGLAAIFLITSPEPTIGRAEDSITLRKVVRICAVVAFLGGLMVQGIGTGGTLLPLLIVGHALSMAQVVAVYGEYVYLRRFARRIPDEKLARQTSVVMWGMAATTLAGVVVGVIGALAIGALLPGGGLPGPPGGAAAPGGAITAGMGVFFAVACVLGAAGLVFGVLNIVLLFRYYGAFKRASMEADQIAAAEL